MEGSKQLNTITMGLAAAGLSWYIYKFTRQKSDPHQIQDVDRLAQSVTADSWPRPRRIVNPMLSQEEQNRQMMEWKKKVLGVFIIKHGEFEVDEDYIMRREEDFLSIYDLIESIGRLKLRTLRQTNET